MFGEVADGYDIVKKVESFGTANGKTKAEVKVGIRDVMVSGSCSDLISFCRLTTAASANQTIP